MKKLFYLVCLTVIFLGCKKNDDDDKTPATTMEEIIYVETNDFNSNANAIIAYRHTGDGALTQISGSPFLTGGAGVSNPTQKLGPADSDQEVVLTSDKKRLLAVNSGSNTISVFNVSANGSLAAVSGSPFPSGGETPCSIYINGDKVFVVNKSDNPAAASTMAPNYVTFNMDGNGALTQIAGAKVETTPGSSPAQILLSNDKSLAFGADFLGFMTMPAVGTLRSFKQSNGVLTPVAGTPAIIAGMGGALGLWQHPSANILYVGFPVESKVGVYNINPSTGELSFQTAVAAGAAACWLRTNASGNRLYCLNSAESTVGVYNTSAPASPVFLDTLNLKIKGPFYPFMGMPFTTSQPFALALSPDEDFLYVTSQHTNPDFSIGNFNYMHVLAIDANGNLSESSTPTQIPVSATVRPKGCAVYKIK